MNIPRVNLRPSGAARLDLLVFAFAVGATFGIIAGVREILAHRYVALGMPRNAAVVFRDVFDTHVATALVFVAAILLLELVARAVMARRKRGRQGHSWALAIGLAAGLAVFLHYGWMANRYDFAPEWRTRVEWHGLPLRRALLAPHIWRTNITIVLGAIATTTAMFFLVRGAERLLARPSIRGATNFVTRPVAVIGLLAFAAGSLLPPVFFHREPRGPNVMIISLDTLRGDHLGCYGYPRDTSPAIDRLASESVRFANCYSQAPNTFPSHASLFTSRYPTLNRTSLQGQKLPRWRTTASELFREAGYRTSAIVDAGFLTEQFGMSQGYDDFVGWGRRVRNIVPRAIRWLDRHGDEPFFLFVHCYDIHNPYATEPRYQVMFQERPYTGIIDPAKHYLRSYLNAVLQGREPAFEITREDVDHLVSRYDGGIRYTDDHLATLFDHMRASGVFENTIVVLLSDHGEEFLEHGTVLHTELYRTVTLVPLLISLPGGAKASTVVEEPVGLVDLLPTLVELAGIRSATSFQGRSLVDLMNGERDRAPRYVYGEFEEFGGRQAVYDGPFHLVRRLDRGRDELFRVDIDPLEQNDLAPLDSTRLRELDGAIDAWVATQQELLREESGLALEDLDLDPRTIENLKALGYIR